METTVKLSLGGNVVVKTTGKGNVEDLAGQASSELSAKAYMTLTLEITSPELTTTTSCDIRVPANSIMAEVKRQMEKILQQAARDKDMKQFTEAKLVFEAILKTMQTKYPDLQLTEPTKEKIPSLPKAGMAAATRKYVAKPKAAVVGQTNRDQSPVRSSSENSYSESEEVDEHGTQKSRWDEPGTIAKFAKEWQELWPAFKAFFLNKEILWEKQHPVYERVWQENEFFIEAKSLLLPLWMDKKNAGFTEVSLMAWILRQHQSHTWHEMKQTEAAFVGNCAGCGGAGPLSWKFLADPKNPVDAVWYGNCCGKSLELVFEFLGITHMMIKEKRRTKGNLGGALRWWCRLVDCLEYIADLAKK
jgi:hypothetical protein